MLSRRKSVASYKPRVPSMKLTPVVDERSARYRQRIRAAGIQARTNELASWYA